MGQPNLPQKVLVVDDDQAVVRTIEDILGKLSIKVEKATTLETAFYLFNQQRFDVALIEMEFGPLDGLALVQKWRQHENQDKQCTGFIMMTGNKNLSSANPGLTKELGNLESIVKPFGPPQILPLLARALVARKRALTYQEMKIKVLDYYTKSGDLNKAVAILEKQLPTLGDQGYRMLDELFEKSGRHEDALVWLDKLLVKDPDNITLLNAKGGKLLKLGRLQDAKHVLLKADQLAPHKIERINELAAAHMKLKEGEDAVQRLKQLLELSPEDPELKFTLFGKLYDHGLDKHAIDFGKEAAEPMEIVRHYNNKGVLLAKEGNADQALRDYARALMFYPKFRENYRIHFNIALAHMHHKTIASFEQAVKHLKLCLELAPDFEKAKTMLTTAEQVIARSRQAKGPKRAS